MASYDSGTPSIRRRSFLQASVLFPFIRHLKIQSSQQSEESSTGTRKHDWPTYRVNSQRTGYHPTASPPQDEIKKLWSFHPRDVPFSNSPVVANDQVYIHNANSLYSLDQDSGKENWEYKKSVAPLPNGVTVANGRLYVSSVATTRGSGIFGQVVMRRVDTIEPDTGKTIWHYTVDKPHWTWTVVPAVTDDIVYIGGETTGGNATSKLIALNKATGTKLWEREWGPSQRLSSPAVGNESVYIRGERALRAFNQDGSEKWVRELLVSQPLVSDGFVITVGHGTITTVYAFDAETGDRVWEHEVPNPDDTFGLLDPCVGNGRVLVCSTNGRIFAFDQASGDVQWQTDVGDIKSRAAPVAADGRIYFPTFGGSIFVLNVNDGKPVARYDIDDKIAAPIAITEGNIFVSGYENNRLYRFVERSVPSVQIQSPTTKPMVGEQVSFTLNISNEYDIVAIEWSISAPSKDHEFTGSSVNFTYQEAGTHIVLVRVRNEIGETGRDMAEIVVEKPTPSTTTAESMNHPVTTKPTSTNSVGSETKARHRETVSKSHQPETVSRELPGFGFGTSMMAFGGMIGLLIRRRLRSKTKQSDREK